MGILRVGINGAGRIGRTLIRQWALQEDSDLEIVACNNPGVTERYVHLLKYDSVHGVFPAPIQLKGDVVSIGQKKITFLREKNPGEIPWAKLQVDLVIDATGLFKDKKALSEHLGDSVKKVIMCAPGSGLDATLVMGVNHKNYDPKKHNIVSNASCTTNCLAPLAKIIDQHFKIESGLMSTVHAYTLDQVPQDSAHKDMRRARAAAINMIPTTTGAAKAVGEVIPSLKGKLDGHAIRVPVANVSLVDFAVNLKKSPSAQEINEAIKEACQREFKGIMGYNDLPLVSQDFNGRCESAIFDAPMTDTIGKFAKVVAWYDNEVGFSARVLDLASYIGQRR